MESAGSALELPLFQRGLRNAHDFQRRSGAAYSLLPFRFLPLDDQRYIATNFVGELAVIGVDDLRDLVQRRLMMHGPLYNELKSKHFILDGDSTVALDLLALKYRTKQSLLARLTSLFMFVVTLRCEHSCPYCQVSRQSLDRQAFDMKEQDADRAIAFLFATPSPEIKIEFQGGEPLLNFPLVQKIVRTVKERSEHSEKRVQFVIATNLALMNSEVADFCREHDVFISTSLDGPRGLHNSNRPRPGGDSYERAIEGIQFVRNQLGNDRVSALMTTTRASLDQPEAIVDEYVSQGFSSIFLRWLSPFGFAVKTGAINHYTADEWIAFYKRALAYIIKLNLDGVVFREEFATLLLRKMLTPFPTGYVDLQSPAGIGIAALAFNYNGKIYASDESRMLAEMGDQEFCLGHLASETFESVMSSEKLVNYLAATMTESMPMCADCGVQPFCGSDPVFHYATQGDAVGFKPTSGFCRKQMEITKHLVRLLTDDPETGGVLRSWIT
jgi:uncharacterized protein